MVQKLRAIAARELTPCPGDMGPIRGTQETSPLADSAVIGNFK
jgi:hypothetical protein